MIQNNNNDVKSIVFEDKQIRKVVTHVDGFEKVVWEKVFTPEEAGVDVITLTIPTNEKLYKGFYRLNSYYYILTYDGGVDFVKDGQIISSYAVGIDQLQFKHSTPDIAYFVYKGTNIEDFRMVRVKGDNHWNGYLMRDMLAGGVLSGASGNDEWGSVPFSWNYTNCKIVIKGNGYIEFVGLITSLFSYNPGTSVNSSIAKLRYYASSPGSPGTPIDWTPTSTPIAMGTNGAVIRGHSGSLGTEPIYNVYTITYTEDVNYSGNLGPLTGIVNERTMYNFTAWPLDGISKFRIVQYRTDGSKKYKVMDVDSKDMVPYNIRESTVLPNGSGILYLVMTDKNTMYYCELEA